MAVKMPREQMVEHSVCHTLGLGMATFCKPFTKATIRYFDHAEAVEARKWLEEV